MRSAYIKALLVGALLALPAGLILIWEVSWPGPDLLQPNRFYLGTDFVNYWSAGRLALWGNVDVVYDIARYRAQLHDWFLPELRPMMFSYPPHALLGLSLVGAFPYFVGLCLWSLAGLAGFIAVAFGRTPQRDDAMLLWAILLAPVVWNNIVHGQIGLLLATLFVGALRALPTRPILAGVLIGVLTIKPQLGLLLAPMLLLLQAWRALAAAIVSTLVLIGLSVAAFGVESWQVYFADTSPYHLRFVETMEGFYRFQMTTPYTLFWFSGLPVKAALALQAVMSVLVALAACAVIRSAADWPLKATVVAFGSVLLVPYVMTYDLAIPFAALVWYLREGKVRVDPAGLAIIGLAWALPFGLGTLIQTQGIPLLPVVLLVCYVWLVAPALGWRWIGLERPAAPASRA
jgi:hypothetical protein